MAIVKLPKAVKATAEAEKKAEAVVEKEQKVEKKAAPKAAPKAAAKKSEEIFVQFGGSEWSVAELKEAAKAAYVAEGHRASSIKKLAVYIKPEERKAYYVINEKDTGSIDF